MRYLPKLSVRQPLLSHYRHLQITYPLLFYNWPHGMDVGGCDDAQWTGAANCTCQWQERVVSVSVRLRVAGVAIVMHWHAKALVTTSCCSWVHLVSYTTKQSILTYAVTESVPTPTMSLNCSTNVVSTFSRENLWAIVNSKGGGESVVGIGARVTWASVRDMLIVGIRVRIKFYWVNWRCHAGGSQFSSFVKVDDWILTF